MKGLSRRALAATAASGAAMLVAAAAAHAQKPASVGDGVKTGQLSVQMFNYGGYISNGGNTGPANPVTGVSAACATSTTPQCRLERLERLFAFLESKGVTSVELFGHAGFPADTDIAGLQAYRALLDKYHLHAGGWHGSHERGQLGRARERREDPRRRLHRLRRRRRPGHRHLRRGARERERAQPPGQEVRRGRRRPGVHPQPRAGVRSPVRRRRRAQDGVRHPHGEHGPALRRGRGRRLLVLRRVRRRDGHADRRADQQVVERPRLQPRPDAPHQGRHRHRAAQPGPAAAPASRARRARASSTSGRSSPPRTTASATTTRSRTAAR